MTMCNSSNVFDSPVGRLVLVAREGRLCLCDWASLEKRRGGWGRFLYPGDGPFGEADFRVVTVAIHELHEYFSGTRSNFDIPLRLVGTPFQQIVWRELLKIPYGQTISYAGIAESIGRPNAVRAVANAIGANPLSIFVPCHRVIGSDGHLTGYAGGLPAKKFLLNLENKG